MSEKLKPCPHCTQGSGEFVEFSTGPGPYMLLTWHCVMCDTCGFTAESATTEAEAIAAWNRRGATEEDVERVALLVRRETGASLFRCLSSARAALRAMGWEVPA
jgi:Lar family restriction alleviation protein